MKTHLPRLLVVACLLLMGWSCERENLAAESSEDTVPTLDGREPSICFDPTTLCCTFDSVYLAEADGNEYVDFCTGVGSTVVPCAPGQPRWGHCIVRKLSQNNLTFPTHSTDFMLGTVLAPGWLCDSWDFAYGPAGSIPPNGNQPPVVTPNWHSGTQTFQSTFGPLVAMAPQEYGPASYQFSLRFHVAKLNLFGAVIPGSSRYLYSYTPIGNNPGFIFNYDCEGCSPPTAILDAGTCTFCGSKVTATFFGCERVSVISCHPIKQVVIVYDDCSREYHDNLNASLLNYQAVQGKAISHVWVRSGCRGSASPSQDLIDTNGFSYTNVRRFRLNGFCNNPACQ